MKNLFVVLFLIFSCISCSETNISEKNFIVREYSHDSRCFTQGLELDNGYLYESCGLYGKSYIQKYKLGEEKHRLKKIGEEKYFYEGLTLVNEKIYLLTRKSKIVKILSKDDFSLIEIKRLPSQIGEGWGITHDNNFLYVSNGTENIYKLNYDLDIVDKIKINKKYINELEFYNGKIYANIWKTPIIIIVDFNKGVIEKEYNFQKLASGYTGQKVLNGITFLKNENILITGKNWSKIYEIDLKKY